MSKFRLANFWNYKVTSPEEIWLARFIRHRFKKHPNVLISSVLGPREDIKPAKDEYWIHFCGENNFDRFFEYEDSLVGASDLSLDFWGESRPGAMRFPLWIWYFFPPEADLLEVGRLLKSAEDSKEDFALRDLDLSMVAGHKGFYGCPREEFVQKVHQKEIAFFSEGRYAKNSNLLSQCHGDELEEYLKRVKFYFCPENSQACGYTTEKLFSCLLSGAVPIYWGSCGLPEFDILNQERIIKVEELGVDGSLNQVSELLSRTELLEKFAMQPIFKMDAAETIFEFYEQLAMRLKKSRKFL